MRIYDEGGQASLFAPDGFAGRMSPACSAAASPKGRTSGSSWNRSPELQAIPYLSLNLTPGAGNLLGNYEWELHSPWRGRSSTLNTGPAPPSGDAGCSLSLILQDNPPRKYYLTRRACLGILRRAKERGKPLPPQLHAALLVQAGLAAWDECGLADTRDITAGFSAGAGASAGSIGYSERAAPTLKAGQSGNRMPSVLCLNDQGGSVMDCTEDKTGTLRAQQHGHQPLVFENHGIDSRYTGPHPIVPTLSARAGTGGNNLPLALQPEPTMCICGNAIDRQPRNGGNGIGIQNDVAYTLTSADRHAIFRRQRVDKFREDDTASTQSARQGKDATDLICQPSRDTLAVFLIRRLTPLECERLQGFPDGWTDLPGASDSGTRPWVIVSQCHAWSISWRASPGRRRGADIVAYACFPAKSLLLLVMAIYRRDRYTCVTKQKGGQSMEENVKNLCAPIPAGLHARVREEQEVSGKTLGQYMAWLIQTFYDNQKEETTMSGDKRTVAFQVPGELFERFKDYLQEKGIKQNAFFLDCIHRALAEAQEECKAAGDTANEGHVEQEGRLPEEAVAETEGETDGCDEDTEESSTEG